MDPAAVLTPPSAIAKKKRTIHDPRPRFKADRTMQADAIWGLLDAQIPADHLARGVWTIVSTIDVAGVEARYSPLGRYGYPPRRLLALWIYASLLGEHEGSKVSARCKTDSAFRWICGGHTPSPATVKRFRHSNGPLFERALERTVALAAERGLVDVTDLAVDSVRLRAHASTKAVRTLSRSTKRLEELLAVRADDLSETARAAHEAKVAKHRDAVEKCEKEGRTNFVTTNELAGLLKFPSGASLPGHRVTVTAAGVESRLVINLLIDADGNDYGKLVDAAQGARETLKAAGIEPEVRLVVAADSGYYSHEDLARAAANRAWLDVVVAPTESGRAEGKHYGRERFTLPVADNPAVCPSGKPMEGPYVRPTGEHEWTGVGCNECPLKSQCIPGSSRRRLTIRPELEEMRRRFAEPDVKARYGRRIATIEPVFAHIEDTMRYRRVTSRFPKTVRAEIFLKALAHNVARLLTARRLRRAYLLWG